MTLSEFQKTNGLTLVALAARLGMPVTTVHGYLSGNRKPALEVLARIEEATDGAVKPGDLRPDLAQMFASPQAAA